MDYKKPLLHTGIIAVNFLWAGSAYISQMYRLYNFLTPEQVDIIALRWNYLAQALGILICAFLLWKFPKLTSNRFIYIGGLFISAAMVAVMLTSAQLGMIVFTGIVMNLLHGSLSAYHFALLGAFIPQQVRGRVFGIAYAIGSLGTYLISLLSGGKLPVSGYAAFIYIGLILINMVLVFLSQNLPLPEDSSVLETKVLPNRSTVFLLISVLFLMSLLNAIGGNYKSAAIVEAKVNLEFARAFYAVGLIIAGVISDMSRKYGALCCFASLFYPFAAISLYGQPSLVAVTWALSYLFMAFYTVYRVIVFVDISGKAVPLLPLAGLGLCVARLGEFATTFINESLLRDSLYSTFIILSLFIPLVFLFINMFQKLYFSAELLPKDKETLYNEFESKYMLTNREREVFRQILQGYSNSEISSKIYISESTVNFI